MITISLIGLGIAVCDNVVYVLGGEAVGIWRCCLLYNDVIAVAILVIGETFLFVTRCEYFVPIVVQGSAVYELILCVVFIRIAIAYLATWVVPFLSYGFSVVVIDTLVVVDMTSGEVDFIVVGEDACFYIVVFLVRIGIGAGFVVYSGGFGNFSFNSTFAVVCICCLFGVVVFALGVIGNAIG